MIHISNSVLETQLLAENVLKQLEGRNLICLRGELGAGKTTFVQGLGKMLGLVGNIVSPTYILNRKYQLKPIDKDLKFKTLWHVDLYRLETLAEIKDLGLTDLWQNRTSLVVIEWPEKIEQLLPLNRADIKIKTLPNGSRELEINLF